MNGLAILPGRNPVPRVAGTVDRGWGDGTEFKFHLLLCPFSFLGSAYVRANSISFVAVKLVESVKVMPNGFAGSPFEKKLGNKAFWGGEGGS